MKTKAIITVAVTLIIGFVLGMLTSAQLRQSRIKKMRVFINGKEHSEMLIEAVQPDPEQRAQIEAIMKKFEKSTREIQGQFRDDFDSLSESYKKDLDTLLTREQRERLKALDEHNREMMQRMRKGDRESPGWRHMPPDDRRRRPGGFGGRPHN